MKRSKSKIGDSLKEWDVQLIKSEYSLKWIGFFIVLMIFVSTQFMPNLSLNYAEDVRGKYLIPLYDNTKYVIEGLPKTVDVTIEGKESSVRNFARKNNFNAYVDLVSLGVGQHIVEIKCDALPSGLVVKTNPKNVSILIKELVQVDKDVQIDYINTELLESVVVLGSPIYDVEKVSVKGAKDVVGKVVSVKALVDVSSPDKLEDYAAKLYAMDKDGNKLDLEIEPEEIVMTVPYAIPVKEVPVKITIVGELPEGKMVRSVELSHSEIKVYAPQNVLDDLVAIESELNYEDLSSNGEVSITINPPESVTKVDQEKLNVKVELGDVEEKIVKSVSVGVLNLDSTLKVVGSPVVDVKLMGLKEDLALVDNKALALFVDLKDMKSGVHEVNVQSDTKLDGLMFDLPEISVMLEKKIM